MASNVTSKIAALVAAISGAIAVIGYRQANASENTVPSDDQLIRIFQTHRGEFERLRQMSAEDIHQSSFISESSISTALPEPRRIKYKNLLGLYKGLAIGVNYDGSTRFIFASVGQAIGPGWAKGIEFVPDEAKLIGTRMDTLDGVRKVPAGVYLREIKPHWFLFYQRDE
jgi:hypothetical protein